MSELERCDDRWICWRCGDLDHLNDSGLCRTCTPPERVVEWWQVAVVIASGEQRRRERRWEVK